MSRGSGGLRTALWSLVVLVLIGVLVAQVTWFQFDRLSAIPQLRPFYEKGCELAGCTLKPLVDVDAIQSRKLVVRTDPDNRAQLIVDAVILNRAGFEQPPGTLGTKEGSTFLTVNIHSVPGKCLGITFTRKITGKEDIGSGQVRIEPFCFSRT